MRTSNVKMMKIFNFYRVRVLTIRVRHSVKWAESIFFISVVRMQGGKKVVEDEKQPFKKWYLARNL